MVKKEDNSGTGYEDRQYPFDLYNRAILRHKTNDEIAHFRLLVRLQQLDKRSDRQESRYKRVGCFNDFIVGVKPNVVVSSEISDTCTCALCIF